MRDGDDRTTLGEVRQSADDGLLVLRIEERGGFVEKDHRGVLQERTGNRNALTLTTGEPATAGSESRVPAVFEVGKKLRDARASGSLAHVIVGGTRPGQSDVLGHGVVEDVVVLLDEGHESGQFDRVDVSQVDTTEPHCAAGHVGETGEQPQQCRLTGAAAAHQATDVPGSIVRSMPSRTVLSPYAKRTSASSIRLPAGERGCSARGRSSSARIAPMFFNPASTWYCRTATLSVKLISGCANPTPTSRKNTSSATSSDPVWTR